MLQQASVWLLLMIPRAVPEQPIQQSQHALVPWVQPWGTVGAPPAPDRVLLRSARRLNRMWEAHRTSPGCSDGETGTMVRNIAARAQASVKSYRGGHAQVIQQRWWGANPDAVAEIRRQLYADSFTVVDDFLPQPSAESVLAYIVGERSQGRLSGGRVKGVKGLKPPGEWVELSSLWCIQHSTRVYSSGLT